MCLMTRSACGIIVMSLYVDGLQAIWLTWTAKLRYDNGIYMYIMKRVCVEHARGGSGAGDMITRAFMTGLSEDLTSRYNKDATLPSLNIKSPTKTLTAVLCTRNQHIFFFYVFCSCPLAGGVQFL